MSETIRVQGRECFFTKYPRGIAVTSCEDILGGAGRWHHKSFAMDGDFHPTEAAAREFAFKHADSQAAPGGAELPQWAIDDAYELISCNMWGWPEDANEGLTEDQMEHQMVLARALYDASRRHPATNATEATDLQTKYNKLRDACTRADQPAGGEASGCELPDHIAAWVRGAERIQKQTINYPMATYTLAEAVLWFAANWHPAPASELAETALRELADLRAQRDAERAARERLVELAERAVVALHMHFHGGINKPGFDDCRKDLCGRWHELAALDAPAVSSEPTEEPSE